MRINSNISSLISYSSLAKTNGLMAQSVERLSTGLRVNRASDDAAGLAISEKMRAQYRGLEQAARNAQDGISMIQTAEGALDEVHSILQRMRELGVQAANDTLTQEDRSYIQLEIDELNSEIDRIAATTQFNRKKLLDGSSDAVWSSDDLSVRVNVKGSLISRDRYGQAVKTEGNYRVRVRAVDAGQGQVLKSNIFTHVSAIPDAKRNPDGLGTPIIISAGLQAVVAGKDSVLRDLSNFYDDNGKFLLSDAQTLEVAFERGGRATFTIYGDDTIEDLGVKLNAAIAEAAGPDVAGGMAQFVGEEKHAPIYIETPGGGAVLQEGVPIASSADPAVIDADVLNRGIGLMEVVHQAIPPGIDLDSFYGGGATTKLAEDLLGGLLEKSAKLIYEAYGIQGLGSTNLDVQWASLGSSVLGQASAWIPPSSVTVEFSTEYFKANPNPDMLTLRTTVLHELTHAMQYNAYPGMAQHMIGAKQSAEFLTEGMAEYISDGNYRLDAYISRWGLSDDDMTAKLIRSSNAALDGSNSTTWSDYDSSQEYYINSYLATRYLDKKLTEFGSGGIKGFLATLKTKPGTPAGFDEALRLASNGKWNSLDAFKNEISSATTGTEYYNFVLGVVKEDKNADAGLIGGKHASGGAAKTRADQVDISGYDYKQNPLGDYGYGSTTLFGKGFAPADPNGGGGGGGGGGTTPPGGGGGGGGTTPPGGGGGTVPGSGSGTGGGGGGGGTTLARASALAGTLQSVEGTLLLHSGVSGNAGRMSLSGSEELIHALGFSEVQEARDARYAVEISDAHSGASAASALFTGSTMVGVLHENVDISIGANFALAIGGSDTSGGGGAAPNITAPNAASEMGTGITAFALGIGGGAGGGAYGTYRFERSSGEFIVHIADSSTALQIGANEGEISALSFGDTSSHALGVDTVRVTSRELASRSITKIDRAISEVSRRRARLGAYQNRLERTITSLATASTNLKSSESRIRDLDMAKEMMNFTRLNILSQAGSSMLAQANAHPQNVLSLIR